MNLRDGLIVLTIFGLIIGVFFLRESNPTSNKGDLSNSVSKNEPVVEEGSIAPDFELDTLSGEKIILSEKKGKPTLLIFWASWCGACRSELPSVQSAFEQYKDQVNILAVNGTSQDKEEKVKEFIDTKKFTFPVLLDKKGVAFSGYGIRALPTAFLITKDGIIRWKKLGAATEEELQRKLDDILKEA